MVVEQIEQNAVLEALRRHLHESGYNDVEYVGSTGGGGTGPDASASKDGKGWAFESIGYAAKGPKRSRDFYTSVWQVLGRLEASNVAVLCLPNRFKDTIGERINSHKSAWEVLGNAFEGRLHIWFWVGGDEWKKNEWNDLLTL